MIEKNYITPYYPKYSVLVYLWGFILLIPSAWIISKLQKAIQRRLFP